MRVALAKELGGIDGVELGELPDPAPAAGQALVRVHGAGVGPWDVGFLGGGFPGLALPFVPGQEVAGVVEAAGDGAGVQPGERVYASPVPGGWRVRRTGAGVGGPPGPHARPGELPRGGRAGDRRRDRPRGPGRPGVAAGGRNRAHHRRRGRRGQRRRADRGGHGRPPLGVASPPNHDYLRGLGASEVFDYHAADWVQQVLAVVPGGVDLLLTASAARPGTRPWCGPRRRPGDLDSPPSPSRQLERGITGESFAAHIDRQRLEALSRLVDAGQLRPQVEAVLPWARFARRWAGSRAGTPAARSCSRSGP